MAGDVAHIKDCSPVKLYSGLTGKKSAVILKTDGGAINNVLIENNWMNGGGYNKPLVYYQFQYRNGSTWVNIVNVTDNSNAVVSHSFSAVTTSKVRLYGAAGTDNYLRLYEIEVIGQVSGSKAISKKAQSSVKTSEKFNVTIFPNPVTGKTIHVNLNGYQQEELQSLEIIDLNGHLVLKVNNIEGQYFDINISQFNI